MVCHLRCCVSLNFTQRHREEWVESMSPVMMQSNLNRRLLLGGIAAVFVTLAMMSAMSRRPWSDEGWFAAPAWNLATNGVMGTPVLEAEGWLRGIREHTYWVMPLHLVTQAAWYRLLGFSILSQRLLSTCFGLLALVAIAVIVQRLSGDRRAGALAFALLAFDYTFINGASFGRMDVMCAALGLSALAVYLALRERHLKLAVLLSHSLTVLSGMTHFNGILWLTALLFLTLYFDRARLTWQLAAIAAMPYLIGASAWSVYILQDPVSFWSQFTGNAATGGRLRGLAAPWQGFIREATGRYFTAFGLGAHSAGHSATARLKVVILIVYLFGIIGAVSTRSIRRHRGCRALLLLTLLVFCIMALLDGQKLAWYLVHIIPFYAAILAVYLSHSFSDSRARRRLAFAAMTVLVTVQLGGITQRIRLNSFRESYQPAVSFLKQHAGPQSLVMGSAELGFELGFDARLIDDPYLGCTSGKRADYIVVEEIYEDSFSGSQRERPAIYQHITRLLAHDYRLVYDHNFYRIYAREPQSGELAANGGN